MMTQPQLAMIQTSLRDKLLARLVMRWPKAATYMPEGTNRVLSARPLPDVDQAQLDTYTVAYQDAIEDILGMLDKSDQRPQPPLALRMAESSVFQGGTMPERVGPRHGHWLKEAKRHSGRRDSEARRRLEDLFTGGADGQD